MHSECTHTWDQSVFLHWSHQTCRCVAVVRWSIVRPGWPWHPRPSNRNQTCGRPFSLRRLVSSRAHCLTARTLRWVPPSTACLATSVWDLPRGRGRQCRRLTVPRRMFRCVLLCRCDQDATWRPYPQWQRSCRCRACPTSTWTPKSSCTPRDTMACNRLVLRSISIVWRCCSYNHRSYTSRYADHHYRTPTQRSSLYLCDPAWEEETVPQIFATGKMNRATDEAIGHIS